MSISLTAVNCDYCEKRFERETSRIRYNEKRGITLCFCCRGCKSKHTLENRPDLKNNIAPGRALDDLSPFRNHLKRMKTRRPETTTTLLDLKDQWSHQNGLCAISGQKMLLPLGTGEKLQHQPLLASIDRIDSSKGYTTDNIQWVCLIAQYAKNVFSNQDVIQFCLSTAKYQVG